MTAPLYLVGPGALDGVAPGGVLVLEGDEGHHAATVRRARPGETLLVADGLGAIARCAVESVGAGSATLRILSLSQAPAPAPRLVLAQALAKGGRDELAIETATELGVDAVVPWQAARSVVAWSGERGERSRRRWESTVRAAAKQARRATVPQVRPTAGTLALAVALAAASGALVLHEDAADTLAAAPLPPPGTDGEIVVVVGPEGGIPDDELATLTSAGALAVRLGPHVLRSSSAGPAALAVLSLRLGRW